MLILFSFTHRIGACLNFLPEEVSKLSFYLFTPFQICFAKVHYCNVISEYIHVYLSIHTYFVSYFHIVRKLRLKSETLEGAKKIRGLLHLKLSHTKANIFVTKL